MIRFDQVTKSYARSTRPALNDVSLEILGGEFVFLVGASGSGKSSFLRLVLKEERPTRGDVHVLGRHLNSLADRKVPYFRRSLGVVFQDFRLLPGKTVFDNVAFSLQVIGKSKGFIREAVPDVLKLVGLAGKQGRLPHELSGGEQQRVAIARAVVNKPSILLADEPTGNLDPATSAGIMQLLSTINANGTTVVMATHDVGIVDEMRRRVIELVGGQVIRDERQGGYQTRAVPVQRADDVLAEAEASIARVEEPTPEAVETETITVVDTAPGTAAGDPPDEEVPGEEVPGEEVPGEEVPGEEVPAAAESEAEPEDARDPEPPAAPIRPAVSRPAPAPLPDLDEESSLLRAPVRPVPPPARESAPDRGAPPPLNEPGPRR